jgi:hypothetical protein
MLLILLLGIADFGRVFSAGIAIEAATRNAAELGAIERLRNPPPTDPTEQDAYYADLHRRIVAAACDEMTALPPPDDHRAGADCQHLSAVRVCVLDGIDTLCGQPVPGIDASVPGSCEEMTAAVSTLWPNSSGGSALSHSVEVMACYQFSTLFDLDVAMPMNAGLGLGDVFLERRREFVVDCPPAGVPTC